MKMEKPEGLRPEDYPIPCLSVSTKQRIKLNQSNCYKNYSTLTFYSKLFTVFWMEIYFTYEMKALCWKLQLLLSRGRGHFLYIPFVSDDGELVLNKRFGL